MSGLKLFPLTMRGESFGRRTVLRLYSKWLYRSRPDFEFSAAVACHAFVSSIVHRWARSATVGGGPWPNLLRWEGFYLINLGKSRGGGVIKTWTFGGSPPWTPPLPTYDMYYYYYRGDVITMVSSHSRSTKMEEQNILWACWHSYMVNHMPSNNKALWYNGYDTWLAC